MIMKNLSRIIVVLTLGLTFSVFNSLSSIAQTSADDLNSDTLSPTNAENSGVGNANFNPFDLIHNMNLNRGNFDSEAANENLDEAANNFKVMRQQLLLEMLNQNTTEATEVENTENNTIETEL